MALMLTTVSNRFVAHEPLCVKAWLRCERDTCSTSGPADGPDPAPKLSRARLAANPYVLSHTEPMLFNSAPHSILHMNIDMFQLLIHLLTSDVLAKAGACSRQLRSCLSLVSDAYRVARLYKLFQRRNFFMLHYEN